jgi:hypothetical protein
MKKFHPHDSLFPRGRAIFSPQDARDLQTEVTDFTQVLGQVKNDSVTGYEELGAACGVLEGNFAFFIKETMRTISRLCETDAPIPYPSIEDLQLLTDIRKQAQAIRDPMRPLVLCTQENRIDNDLIKKVYALHVEQHELVARCFETLSFASEAHAMRDMGSVIENAASIFVPTRSAGGPGSSVSRPKPSG